MTIDWKSALRAQISQRAEEYAIKYGKKYYRSLGTNSTVFFVHDDVTGEHGNFHRESYLAIQAVPQWHKRLKRRHSQIKALPPEHQDAKELDSSNSSDALLMNCFCYPRAAPLILGELVSHFPVGPPEFGVNGLVPLKNGRADTTKIDMRAGQSIFESKLTERDFTAVETPALDNYRDFDKVFDRVALPLRDGRAGSYQLIRNVLAAYAHKLYFGVIIDARRPDLLRLWWHVFGAIRERDLRDRCTFILWQEIAGCSALPLQEFLSEKYGLLDHPPVHRTAEAASARS